MALSFKLCYRFLLVIEISVSRDFKNFPIIQKIKYSNQQDNFFSCCSKDLVGKKILYQKTNHYYAGLSLEIESWAGNSSNLFSQKSKDVKKFNR